MREQRLYMKTCRVRGTKSGLRLGRCQTCGPVTSVPMDQPQVRAQVRPEIADQLRAEAERLWPGQGRLAVDRLARAAIRKYMRDVNGKKYPNRVRRRGH